MSDGELLELAGQKSELTTEAQEALADELSQRKLKLEPEEAPAPPLLPGPLDPDDPEFDDDRKPVTVCTVWSQADALQVQKLLDAAGIPFFMGPENAAGVDGVTSSFAEGVEVKVMNIGVPWAQQALQYYEPENEPESEKAEEQEQPVRCPKCHSEEVVFEELVPAADPKNRPPQFRWTCDSCGNRWEDNGVLQDA
jgi:DNA-directed RNA polymerase subunit M/transcription elongation factor TFIIS